MNNTKEMDAVDRRLLNILQTRFPLVEEPYRVLGEEMDIPESEIIQRITLLKQQNVIREINAIFDTRKLGYKSTLVAMRFPPERLDSAAHIINRHPGVSHNYAREGYFNLWFTLAVSPETDLANAVDVMAEETNAEACRLMPTVRFFKIGVNFDMVQRKGAATDYYSPDGFGEVRDDWNKAESITSFEIEAIRKLQEDLPLRRRPFDSMANKLELTTEKLFGLVRCFQSRGIMRRYSAVLYHRRAGFRSNAMGVWRVPSERAEEVGKIMSSSPWVTHCYERPTFPDWPYTHFTMIHAQSQETCEEVAKEISDRTGIIDYRLLYSTREYKKTRVRYFLEDTD